MTFAFIIIHQWPSSNLCILHTILPTRQGRVSKLKCSYLLMFRFFSDSRETRSSINDLTIFNMTSNTYRYETVVKRLPVIITGVIDQLHNTCHVYSLESQHPNNLREGLDAMPKIAEGKSIIERISKLKYQMARDHPLESVLLSILLGYIELDACLQTYSCGWRGTCGNI